MGMQISICFFFFQAEDGIRYGHVTGVQTCALPIFCRLRDQIAIGLPYWRRAVDDDEQEIGDAASLERTLDALALDDLDRVTDPRGVHERDLQAVEVDHLRDEVPGRAGRFRHDRP